MPFTFKPEQYILNLIPFQWVREANPLRQFTVEVVPNILMFIPLGIFLPIVMIKMRRFHQAVLPIFSFTFSIELFQYFIGRSSDIDDILSNLLGGMIGFGMYKLLNHLLARKILWKRLTGERE